MVVSDRGDILSPKKLPDTTAPAVQYKGTPMASPMPIMAKPTVPTVPQEVPVAKDTKQAKIQVAGKKMPGVNTLKPAFTMVGTVPAAIQMEINMPTHIKINTAGKPTFMTLNIWCSMSAQCWPFKPMNKPVMQMPMMRGMWGVKSLKIKNCTAMMAVVMTRGAMSNQNG